MICGDEDFTDEQKNTQLKEKTDEKKFNLNWKDVVGIVCNIILI